MGYSCLLPPCSDTMAWMWPSLVTTAPLGGPLPQLEPHILSLSLQGRGGIDASCRWHLGSHSLLPDLCKSPLH